MNVDFGRVVIRLIAELTITFFALNFHHFLHLEICLFDLEYPILYEYKESILIIMIGYGKLNSYICDGKNIK
jgi:hypothetical protein